MIWRAEGLSRGMILPESGLLMPKSMFQIPKISVSDFGFVNCTNQVHVLLQKTTKVMGSCTGRFVLITWIKLST